MQHRPKSTADDFSANLRKRLLRRAPSGVCRPVFDVQPIGVESPSSTLIVERLDVGPLEPQARLVTDLQLHLFLNDNSIDFYRGSQFNSVSVRRGEVGVCPRNEWHSISFVHPISMLSVHIDDKVVAEVALDLTRNMGFTPTLPPVMDDGRIAHLLFALAEEQERGYPTGALLVDTLELAIVKLLVSREGPSQKTNSVVHFKLGPARLKRVLEFMHANLNRKVKLKHLAECAGLSTNFFSAQFHAETGVAPHRYMTELRIGLAKRLLRETRETVLEVAFATGFESQQHFATVFRRLVGVAPTTYRHSMAK